MGVTFQMTSWSRRPRPFRDPRAPSSRYLRNGLRQAHHPQCPSRWLLYLRLPVILPGFESWDGVGPDTLLSNMSAVQLQNAKVRQREPLI
jgi:hypothetical protein